MTLELLKTFATLKNESSVLGSIQAFSAPGWKGKQLRLIHSERKPMLKRKSSVALVPLPGSIKNKAFPKQLVTWCWHLDTNLLPLWIQNGILPSDWDRCGPLKLYLYSKRRWGSSSEVEPPAATSARLRWNIKAVRKLKMNTRALNTAMFLSHCWRSAQSDSMTRCLLGQQGVFWLVGFRLLFSLSSSFFHSQWWALRLFSEIHLNWLSVATKSWLFRLWNDFAQFYFQISNGKIFNEYVCEKLCTLNSHMKS